MKKIALLTTAIMMALTINVSAAEIDDLFVDEIASEDIALSIDEVDYVEDISSVDVVSQIDEQEVELFSEEVCDTLMSVDSVSCIEADGLVEDVISENITNDMSSGEDDEIIYKASDDYELILWPNSDGGLKVVGYNWLSDTKLESGWPRRIDLVIPDKVNGIDVTEIGDFAFRSFPYIVDRVILPTTLKRIGNYAFNHCKFNLYDDLAIPEGVEVIGEGAFSGLGTATTTIILPTTLKEIGDSAFAGGTFFGSMNKADLIIPEGVEKIGDKAFCGCDNFENIVIPSTVKMIGNDAFSHIALSTIESFYHGRETADMYIDYNVKSITNNSIVPVRLSGIGILAWYNSEDGSELMSVCNGQTAVKSEFHYVRKMDDIMFVAGQKINLDEYFRGYIGDEAAIRYIVDNNKIASVSGTMLNGLKVGTTTVTAQEIIIDGRTKTYEDVATCEVEVLAKPVLKFARTCMSYQGQSIDANEYFITNDTSLVGATYWQSSNPNVIEVVDPILGILEAKKEGSAKISAYFGEKGKKGTLIVGATLTVKYPRFSKNSYSYKTGDKITMAMKNVTAYSNAEFEIADSSIARATTQLDRNGNPTGRVIIECLSCGDTQLTAIIDEQEYTCDIHVVAPKINRTKLTLKKGRTTALSLTNTKINKNNVVWETENSNIAIIENGKIKGMAEGEVVIFTTTGGVRNECTLKVVK